MTPYDNDLLTNLDIPNWKARASRTSANQKSQPRTQEAVTPFVVIQEPSQTTSSKDTQTQSWVASAWSRLKLVVGITMAIFTLCMLLLIVLMWPVIVSSTKDVATCNPPIITTDCPHLLPRN